MKKILLAFPLAFLLLAACSSSSSSAALSSEKSILDFKLTEELNPSLAASFSAGWNASTQRYLASGLPSTASLSGLVATFTLSDGATACVDGALQVSGVTPNDFSSPVVYTVVAADGSSRKYTVAVARAASSSGSTDSGNGSSGTTTGGTLGVSVTLMQFNALDFYVNSTATHDKVAAMLKSASVEIVVLEETEVTGSSSDVVLLQTALVNAGWPMPYAATVETGSEDDIAIVSKYPIASYSKVLAPASSSDWPRPGLLAHITVSNSSGESADLSVFGFHLKAMDDATSLQKRINEASALASYLRTNWSTTISSAYIAVCGDMNTVSAGDRGSTTATLGYLRLLDDSDTTNNFTAVNEESLPGTSTHQDGGVLDHILLSPALYGCYTSGSIAIKTADNAVTMSDISDHYPVLLELDL